MPTAARWRQAEIEAHLDRILEAEYSRIRSDRLAAVIARLGRGDQDFILEWTERAAAAHLQLAVQFARSAPGLVGELGRDMLQEWIVAAMDLYDRAGLQPAMGLLRDPAAYARDRQTEARGVRLAAVAGVLTGFVQGLSGRRLAVAEGDAAYTDTETVFLPPVMARCDNVAANFTLLKATAAMLWAQMRFGTFRCDLEALLAEYPEPERALARFHFLETLRLEAAIGRELPGLGRDMAQLRQALGEADRDDEWLRLGTALADPRATVADTVALLRQAYAMPLPPSCAYQGSLRPAQVRAVMAARRAREEAQLRLRLAALVPTRGDTQPAVPREQHQPKAFAVPEPRAGEFPHELELDGATLPLSAELRRLLASIALDLGAIPPHYLVPAGPGEYDALRSRAATPEGDDAWAAGYHEHDACLYPEWDRGRRQYRKHWCAVRESDVEPRRDGFVAETRAKHHALSKRLRRSFEALRDEDRLVKRQADGEGIDIDALVEATADAAQGREMSERLFTRCARCERSIAVMFMVDMSGSTRGWVNDMARESLIVLADALRELGDAFAIYGFSGWTRKRCEVYRIKRFDEDYGEEVAARIAGIEARDYTRMGAAIRHLARLLARQPARHRLLVTLSDGKPEDFSDEYRGQYGIEDTRRALQEAREQGLSAYCITIDRHGADYLPHMYGPARYTVVEDVTRLPLRIADIYRRLTG